MVFGVDFDEFGWIGDLCIYLNLALFKSMESTVVFLAATMMHHRQVSGT